MPRITLRGRRRPDDQRVLRLPRRGNGTGLRRGSSIAPIWRVALDASSSTRSRSRECFSSDRIDGAISSDGSRQRTAVTVPPEGLIGVCRQSSRSRCSSGISYGMPWPCSLPLIRRTWAFIRASSSASVGSSQLSQTWTAISLALTGFERATEFRGPSHDALARDRVPAFRC